jgi:hypothetical protein
MMNCSSSSSLGSRIYIGGQTGKSSVNTAVKQMLAIETSADQEPVSSHERDHNPCLPVRDDNCVVSGTNTNSLQAVSVSALSHLPSSHSSEAHTNTVDLSETAAIPQSVKTATVSDYTGKQAAEQSVNTIEQMCMLRTATDQETVSTIQTYQSQLCSSVQETSIDHDEKSNGHVQVNTQTENGWQCVYDEVMSLPHQRVIRSVVEQCRSEWYRLGIELGYEHGQIQDMTCDIPTSKGKLQAIIEEKSRNYGKKKTTQALLDACDQIMPLAVVAVMKDLEIQCNDYAVSDHLLFELGNEVGNDWKELAIGLGMTSQEVDNIEMEACTPRDQAWMMLRAWHAKQRRAFSVDVVRNNLQEIRKKQETKQQQSFIFPQNFHDKKTVCGRKKELDRIATRFWGQAFDRETPAEICKYCLQIINGMGGIGKSALGEKYAVLWQKLYAGGVFYFNAESLAMLHISIRRNLRDLSVNSGNVGVFEENTIFLQQIYSRDRVLLLYDGVNDLGLLERILPRETVLVHVLVMTRVKGDHTILGKADQVIALGRLEMNTGVKALQAWRGCADQTLSRNELMFANRLVSEHPIEGLPLAINHVATLMKKTGFNYEQYYQVFKAEQERLQGVTVNLDKLLEYFHISNLIEPLLEREISEPKHLSKLSVEDMQSITMKPNERHLLGLARHFVLNTDHVHLTWQLDIETVKETDSNAMQVLSYASLMACRNIPERLLQPLVFGNVSTYWYRLSVNTLASHSLADVSEDNDGQSLSLHSLVQSTVLERAFQQPEELHYGLNRISKYLINSLLPQLKDLTRHLKDDQLISLLPHVYAVAEKAVWTHNDEICMAFVQEACRIALVSQHADTASYLCSELLKAADTTATFRLHCKALNMKGLALIQVADPHSAQLHIMKVLQLIESCGKHETWMEDEYQLGLGILAGCYTKQEMFKEAENICQIQMSLLNEEPERNEYKIIRVLFLSGQNCACAGNIDKALELYEQVLERLTSNARTDPFDLFTGMYDTRHATKAHRSTPKG